MIARRARPAVAGALLLILACGVSDPSTTTPRPNPHEPERTAELARRARQSDPRLVFLGDSITHFWEAEGREVWDRYYGNRDALNLGIGWEQTENLLWRMEQGHFDTLRPDVYVLMIGTNNSQHGPDGPQEIAAGVRAILDGLLQLSPDSRILLLGIFPRGRGLDDRWRRNNEAANLLLEELADGGQVIFRDIGSVFLREDGTTDPALLPDSLHLSARGYAAWAAAIEPDLSGLLREE